MVMTDAASLKHWIVDIDLQPPTLRNNTADSERLLEAIGEHLGKRPIRAELAVIRGLPARLRQTGYRARCVLFEDRDRWLLLDVLDPLHPTAALGLAVDLGTTRISLRLVDLQAGDILAEQTIDNPQVAVGPDILTRIHHADRPGGARDLQARIIQALNREIKALTATAGYRSTDVYAVSLAANTAMTHLLLGLDCRWMIREPYIPAVNRPPVMGTAELGIEVHPAARIFVFPNVGSYFGGDLIAGVFFSGLHRREETAILVDVGTNAEVVLGNRDWLMACAGAAGPALEGGVTRFGMAAAEGVIDRVRWDETGGDIAWHTIGEQPPRGICGSGLIDLAAVLFRAGMIDIRGKLVPSRCGGRLKNIEDIAHVVVAWAHETATGEDLMISQADIDSLIRSKAAMYTILETITLTMGMSLAELPAFFVAGTFGVFIDPVSAVTIGMLPDLPPKRFIPLGNSSLEGATRLLSAPGSLAEIDRIRDGITYLELNVNQDFMNRFSAAKFLPHTNRGLFPSVDF
ncbi:MAG: ASKHA domain-containing protein [Desulfobacteraceae bacterium]|jgi:uncharacterized 2Fe-2S/4Fe-4S cluster protein (DUF4445 family)|nr:ASKHA domain-containing protein [Desulfobacteraceae bacterium]